MRSVGRVLARRIERGTAVCGLQGTIRRLDLRIHDCREQLPRCDLIAGLHENRSNVAADEGRERLHPRTHNETALRQFGDEVRVCDPLLFEHDRFTLGPQRDRNDDQEKNRAAEGGENQRPVGPAC